MDLDTRHLRALVAIADHGTFTDAAAELGVSQAAVSRSVQRLEAAVGSRLLARTTRSVQATPAGERVLVHARRVLAAVDQLAAAAASRGEDLVVGYAWAALGVHTVEVQREWSRHDHGDLVLVQSNTPTAGLLEGRCEVSVVRRAPTDPAVQSALIGTERRFVACAEDHPLASLASVRLADVAAHPVAVDVETGTTTTDLWPEGGAPAGLRPTGGLDEWLTLIASGRAVGVSSEATATLNPRPGVVYRPLADGPDISVWLAWWRANPPHRLGTLVSVCRAAYG